jgi:predicted PurR-regulated permease PerM
MGRRTAAAIVFFGTLAILLALAGVIAWQFSGEGQRLSNQLTRCPRRSRATAPSRSA